MKKKNKDVDVDLVIKEIKEFLTTGKEMTYVKSFNYDNSYKEKEIKKLIKQNKKNRLKSKFEKIFKKLF